MSLTTELQKLHAAENRQQNADNEKIYYSKTYKDLYREPFPYEKQEIANYKLIDQRGGFDAENWSFLSTYPQDYQLIENENLCTRICRGDVKFFSGGQFCKTLDAKVSEFPALDSPKYYGITEKEMPILPNGTYVEILETITHKRAVKEKNNKKKSYWFIMCKVMISRSNNPDVIQYEKTIDNQKVVFNFSKGQIGYIWYSFMGDSNPDPNSNIVYTYKPGTTGNNRGQRAVIDFWNNSIPFPSKESPQVYINFYTDSQGRCKSNSLNKIQNTNHELFDALYAAGVEANISEINIGCLFHSNSQVHIDGMACDIASLKPVGFEKPYWCSILYDSKTDTRKQPECPEEIEKFEYEFMNLSDSERVWGPWFFHEKNVATNPNIIGTYPEMLKQWPSETTVSGSKTKSSKQVFIEQYVKPFIEDVIADNGYKVWEDANGNDVIMEYNTDEQKAKWNGEIYYHFQHRHHGHYVVK